MRPSVAEDLAAVIGYRYDRTGIVVKICTRCPGSRRGVASLPDEPAACRRWNLPGLLRETDWRCMTADRKARVIVAALEVFERLQAGLAAAEAVERARVERRPTAAEFDRLIAWARECRGMVETRGLMP